MMTAPMKPWEMNSGNVGGSNTLQSSLPVLGDMCQPAGMPLGAPANGRRIRVVAPPLPPRPVQPVSTARSGYYSRPGSYYSPYSTYNSYGLGGVYGNTYGMYGSGNYGMYGMNRYGLTGNDPENRFIQVAEESTRPAFQSIESFVQAFGSISFMLESTFHAIHSSFRAVLSVAENFGRLRTSFGKFFSVFAVLRTLQWMYKKLLFLLGLSAENPQGEKFWQQAAGTAGAPPEVTARNSQTWPVMLFMGIMFIGPYLVWKLLNSLNLIQSPTDNCLEVWKQCKNPVHRAVALYPFVAASQQELSFNPGQGLYLAPRELQTTQGWLLATLDGKSSGLVPYNYVKVVTPLAQANSGVVHVEVPPVVHEQPVQPIPEPRNEMPAVDMPVSRVAEDTVPPVSVPNPDNSWNTP